MAITKLVSGSFAAGVGGKLLQVQRTFYNTPFTQAVTANTKTNFNNLNVNITPASTSSTIFLFGRVFCEFQNQNTLCYFTRDTTALSLGEASGSRNTGMASLGNNYSAPYDTASTPETVSMFTIDSPSTTSQITYHISISPATTATLEINRTGDDSDSNARERGSSEIIAMEIAG